MRCDTCIKWDQDRDTIGWPEENQTGECNGMQETVTIEVHDFGMVDYVETAANFFCAHYTQRDGES